MTPLAAGLFGTRRLMVADIQKRVCAFYGLTQLDMVSARRERSVARPRQVAMAMARRHTLVSLPEIGRRFGNRDHTTVIHAIRRIAELRESDPELDRDWIAIESALTRGAEA